MSANLLFKALENRAAARPDSPVLIGDRQTWHAGALLAAIQRLRHEPCHLRDIADWPGFDRERAARMLNALYLQSGLIVSRSHPDALRESWFGALGR